MCLLKDWMQINFSKKKLYEYVSKDLINVEIKKKNS